MRILKNLLMLVLLVVGVFGGYVFVAMQASLPDDGIDLPTPASTAPSDPRPILIFGGTRNTGLEFAKLLRARGERVVAFVRPSSDRTGLSALDAEFLEGDAMDLDSVRAAIRSEEFRGVITTVGCFKCEPPIDFVANRNIVDAATEAGVDKVLLVTTIGSGNSADHIPALSKIVLAKLLPLKTEAEEHLRAAPLTHVIIRPGGLGSDPATGTGVLSADPSTFGFIDRAELASLMLACMDHSVCDGKTLAAVDAEKIRPW